MEKIVLTKEGKKQLEEKLLYLKSVKRPEVIKAIGVARSYGDLSENSEYEAAKEEQGIVEGEIAVIEEKLRTATVIDKIDTSCINIGCKAVLDDLTWDEEVVYTIVDTSESNPYEGLISTQSPVGQALLGKKVGDKVKIVTPAGESEYIVKEIK